MRKGRMVALEIWKTRTGMFSVLCPSPFLHTPNTCTPSSQPGSSWSLTTSSHTDMESSPKEENRTPVQQMTFSAPPWAQKPAPTCPPWLPHGCLTDTSLTGPASEPDAQGKGSPSHPRLCSPTHHPAAGPHNSTSELCPQQTEPSRLLCHPRDFLEPL